MKLKQQQQRHEKRSEKYKKMGVKKIDGEKSWWNWKEGLLNKTERECKWIIGKNNVQPFTLTSVFPAVPSNFPQCGAYKANYTVWQSGAS